MVTEEDEGDRFFLLKGHIPALGNLITGKRCTLVHAPGIVQLRKERNELAGIAPGEDVQKGLFEQSTAEPKFKRRKKAQAQSDRLTINVSGTDCVFQQPASTDSCLAVLMEPAMLEAVFNFIKEKGVSNEKRAYVASGNFAGRGKKNGSQK